MRPPFRGDRTQGRSGPSDEFLAVDAATEERSFSVLYDRYADGLYRFFLGSTGDPAAATHLMDAFIADLPDLLHRFVAGERSFAGWLFGQASRRLEQNQYSVLRLVRRVRGAIAPGERHEGGDTGQGDDPDLERALNGLRELPLIERQVLVLLIAIELAPTQASEAIGLPTLAVSTRLGTGTATLSHSLSVDSPDDARALLATSLGRVTLSDRQRARHRRMIGAAFGEVDESEPATGSLARQLAVLAAVVVVGFLGLVGWDYVATQLAEDPPVEETAADDDSEIGSAASDAPTTSPDGSAADASAVGEPCMAEERLAVVDQFVQHMNNGEFDELAAMLPESAGERPETTSALTGAVSDLRTVIPFDRDEYNSEALIERIQRSHEAGERWTVDGVVAAEDYPDWFGALSLDPYQEWIADRPELGLVMVNEMTFSPDQTGFPLRGPAVIDCDAEQVIAWGLETDVARGHEPVDVVRFIFSTASLNIGEERVWQVRVQTDLRGDGGGMRTWDLEWRQAVNPSGALMQRGTVYSPGGQEVISFVHDGDRWRLEQRGWTRFGTNSDIPFPEEITQVVPWLNRSAGVIHLHSDDISPGDTRQFASESLDFSTSNAMHADVYAEPEAERTFSLEVSDGAVTAAQLMEVREDGEQLTRPRIHFLNVVREREFDPEPYRFMFHPRYLDRDTQVPRFQMPDDETSDLELESASYAEDGSREEYRITWNDVPLYLTVTPSRGGIDWRRLADEYDDHWRADSEYYDHGVFQWSQNGVNGAPALAIWDNDRFRFDLRLEDMNPSGDSWSLRELSRLADVLSAAGST